VSDVDELLWLGADEVVPEEFETFLEIFDLVLLQYQIPKAQILQKQAELRKEGYAKLRREKISQDPPTIGLPEELHLERYRISEDSTHMGKSLSEIALPAKTGALIVSIMRGGENRISPTGSFRLEVGDILFLAGSRDELGRARNCLEGNEAAE
jgi:CPA2 family monovalent cation:H+ antiporter-2